MQAGDLLTIFTDGLTEATAATEMSSASQAFCRFCSRPGPEATRVLDKIEQAVEEFRSSELPQDDLTMVVASAQ